MITVKSVDSARELESIVSRDNIITVGRIQNTYYKICINENFMLGIECCSYGIGIGYMFVNDGTRLFIGVGMHLLCIDLQNQKIIFTKELQSVFYEIIADSNHDYLCIVCELDIYCYVMEEEVWKIGFRHILVDFDIIEDEIISISCEDGEEYRISIKDGKMQ